jgi:hypothetical protein
MVDLKVESSAEVSVDEWAVLLVFSQVALLADLLVVMLVVATVASLAV